MSKLLQILNVAEKPSVAKEVTAILSRRQFQKEESDSKYNPVYSFEYPFKGKNSSMWFTSVTGHVMNFEFEQKYKQWKGYEPIDLLNKAPVFQKLSQDKAPLAKNLKRLSKHSDVVILWLDCDREGEAIAYEVIDICKQAKSSLKFLRAQFSALTETDMKRAMENLREPDERQALAVKARQELDLRVGSAFTQFQTLTLQKYVTGYTQGVVSYGPCQMPTLGFVVERANQREAFISEPFWYLELVHPHSEAEETVTFTWNRSRLYDKQAVDTLQKLLLSLPPTVTSVQKQRKTKTRPLPLATITLTKLATQKLHMSSAKVMELAEKLYQKGFISYPRTETDKFQDSIDLKELVEKQTGHGEWGDYVGGLLRRDKYEKPRQGIKDDKAHPPIHPVKKLEKIAEGVSSEEYKIYELVTRHFLACVSKNAIGNETQVILKMGEEKFKAKGLQVEEPNYLAVYPYEKWTTNTLPLYSQGQALDNTSLKVKAGNTTPPSYLTESELISKMDHHEIGTDATIHDHIKTIQDRQYAIKESSFLKPTPLGKALVESYNQMELPLALPTLRSDLEKQITAIAEGSLQIENVLNTNINNFLAIFNQLNQKQNFFVQNMKKSLQGCLPEGIHVEDIQRREEVEGEAEEEMASVGKCPCGGNLSLVRTEQSRMVKCSNGCNPLRVPKSGQIGLNDHTCPQCNYKVFKMTAMSGTEYNLCPYCYSNSPSDSNQTTFTPCFKCINSTCQLSATNQQPKPFTCPICKQHQIEIKCSKKGQYYLVCGGKQKEKCNTMAFMHKAIHNVQMKDSLCPSCQSKGVNSQQVAIRFNPQLNLHSLLPDLPLKLQSNDLFCLYPNCDTHLNQLDFKYIQMEDNNNNHNSNNNFNNRSNNNFNNNSNNRYGNNTNINNNNYNNNNNNNNNNWNKFKKKNEDENDKKSEMNKKKKKVENKKEESEKKKCESCGVEGRHPRGSKCDQIKRKKTNDDDYIL